MIPLWLALLLVGATGVACWLVADSVGYWRAMDELADCNLRVIRAANDATDRALVNIAATIEQVVAENDRREVERLIEETK